MKLSIKLESDAKILSKITRAVQKKINRIDTDRLEQIFKESLRAALFASPTYSSLIDSGNPNSLAADFGFRQGQEKQRVDPIIEKIVESISISRKVNRRPKTIQTVFTVSGVPAGHNDILSMSEAFYFSNGNVIEWLDWILIQGDSQIIENYKVVSDNLTPEQSRQSRSRVAIMVEDSIGFSVRMEYRGNVKSNFVIDAINQMSQDGTINKRLLEEIKKVGR